ncbi:MAG: type IV conjugative transfer system lipoprotein TraV [Terriglobia bacterium]|nr:type IV conjugative transfer system lipoprotein TraV [Terriglobia bacterium]
MNRSAALVLTLLPLLALAGCVTDPPYGCPLRVTGGCSSMSQIYNVARKAPLNAQTEQIMTLNSKDAAKSQAPAQVSPYEPSAYTEPGQVGEPIFHQPQVYRVWIAPYVDADGNLRSGQYTYFSTPGAWDYGRLDDSGIAGGAMFTPQKPGNLGFTPAPKTAASPPPSPSGNANGLPTPSSAAPVTNSEGITQPSASLSP